MRLLLDTHTLIWWMEGSSKISKKIAAALRSSENAKYVSVISIWEMRLKESLGKLELPGNFREVLEAQPIEHLSITPDHAHAYGELPLHHRDPFDRMLVAQALVEGLTLVTEDRDLHRYAVPILTG